VAWRRRLITGGMVGATISSSDAQSGTGDQNVNYRNERRKGDVPQNPLDVGEHLIHVVKCGVASQDGIIKLV